MATFEGNYWLSASQVLWVRVVCHVDSGVLIYILQLIWRKVLAICKTKLLRIRKTLVFWQIQIQTFKFSIFIFELFHLWRVFILEGLALLELKRTPYSTLTCGKSATFAGAVDARLEQIVIVIQYL